MPIEITEFYQDFFQDIVGTANVDGEYLEDAFFEKFCDFLIEEGELETADRVYLHRRGLRVDGYGGDPRESGGLLTLIVCDFDPSNEISTLTATEMEANFKRTRNFLSKTLDASFRNELEETHPAFGLSDMIAARWRSTHKVRIILITNRIISSRIDGRAKEELDGTPITHTVWDLSRIFKIATSKQRREEIEIDLEGEFGGSLPVLPAALKGTLYKSYLAVVPGYQLAQIYDRWHTRLLEQNVRVFLQFRGKVNKGMRVSLEFQPDMFFAYNNGITATAEEVEVEKKEDQLYIKSMKNFQIVNGGQTTAAIHAASKRKGFDLTNVFVQMKLSIIDPDHAQEVVPKISEYANSQNKVTAADFFSNHPFHVRMEEFSRRIYFRSPEGGFRETKWFYERARGQYNDARANLTSARKRRFEEEFPKRQVFSKTDLAKFLNVWRSLPHIVSRGAQKNFAEFGKFIDAEWEKDDGKGKNQLNELFYRHTIAKALIFKEVERIVSDAEWYQGGYRANIVAYAISKVAYDLEQIHKYFDFDIVYQNQLIGASMSDTFRLSTKAVHDILVNPPETSRNVTEWAKKEDCWNRVRLLRISWPDQFLNSLISESEIKTQNREEGKKQKELTGIQAMTAVLKAGREFWIEVRDWGRERNLLTEKEEGILEVAVQIPGKYPSDKQSLILVSTIQKLNEEGFQNKLEVIP